MLGKNGPPGIAELFRRGWEPAPGRGRALGGAGKGFTRTRAASAKRKATPAKGGARTGTGKLSKQRDLLAQRFAEMQYDLGGIAYEMAIRDRFKHEVLKERAGKLKELDAQLGQVEGMLRMGATGAAGKCPNCEALQAKGAKFCWQCGFDLAKKPAAKSKAGK